MPELPETLRDNVRLLGELLGEIILEHEGPGLFRKVEDIRHLGKVINQTEDGDSQPLIDMLDELEDKDILPLVRAFNQFLNLANIAEQEYNSSAEAQGEDGLDALLENFSEKLGKDELAKVVSNLGIELVLTAHPTEITRRTLIRKYDQIADTLSDKKRTDLLPY